MQLETGQEAELVKTISEADVMQFARLTGDFNPLHVDEAAAQASRFGRRIAHGMLTASLICPVLGMKLPGEGTVHLEQSLRFLKPVYPGDTITAKVRVTEVDGGRGRARLRTWCTNQDDAIVIEGDALVMIPRTRTPRPEAGL
jgi:3-hydroxybutyryl-CoA dehydratase